MYISGVPGTGKTATVSEVLSILKEEQNEGEISGVKFIDVNGMRLTDPHQAFVQILKVCRVVRPLCFVPLKDERGAQTRPCNPEKNWVMGPNFASFRGQAIPRFRKGLGQERGKFSLGVGIFLQ